jgi:hypothetical protein
LIACFHDTSPVRMCVPIVILSEAKNLFCPANRRFFASLRMTDPIAWVELDEIIPIVLDTITTAGRMEVEGILGRSCVVCGAAGLSGCQCLLPR